MEGATGARVAFVTRLGSGVIPGRDTVYQEGDLLHLTLLEEHAPRVERVLHEAPEEH
jgi:trk system potassium uptake protein TrkA